MTRTEGAVLRQVVMHDMPHDLSRPRASPGLATRAVQPMPLAPQLVQDVPALSFEDGLAQGYREGLAAGRAALEAEAEASLRAALEEAQEKGRTEGLQFGRDAAAQELAAEKVRLESDSHAALQAQNHQLGLVLESLRAQSTEMVAQAEDDLVALCHDAICRILADRAATPEVVQSMVRRLLARHALGADVVVHLHPEDAALLPDNAGTGWRFEADPAVQLGGALLVSPEGKLDARLEVQLGNLRQTLLEVRRQTGALR